MSGNKSEPGTRLDYTLNLYGDRPLRLTGTHGTDISSTRMDELDRAAIAFAQGSSGIVGVDIGCGLGIPSIVMALLGANMILLDQLDLAARFAQISSLLPTDKIQFVQGDIRHLPAETYPPKIDLFYSQRTLHYLSFAHAKNLLRLVSERMPPSGKGFLSVSGIRSELSDGYGDSGKPINDRFGPLSEAMATKHEIRGPVCLYSEEDMEHLIQESQLRPEKIWSSAFGNIKAIFAKA